MRFKEIPGENLCIEKGRNGIPFRPFILMKINTYRLQALREPREFPP